ncbi:hypothetical protein F5883DRAFT_692658 [Diaporthe sp. PMI_573]|nr:hypothetical protein F5883DRAFT_692658 [Diaporthaceae sp. PMI_573]
MGLAPDHAELFVWRIEFPRGRPFLADAIRLGLRENREKYAAILRQFVDFGAAPLGDAAEAEAGRTAPHNRLADASNMVIQSNWSGFDGLLFWAPSMTVALPLGASLCGLLWLEGVPLKDDGKKDPAKSCTVDRFPFAAFSRDVYDLETLWLEHLVRRGGMPPVEHNERPWKHLFQAMIEGVKVAANATDGDKMSYEEQVSKLAADWYLRKLGAMLATKCIQRMKGGLKEDLD